MNENRFAGIIPALLSPSDAEDRADLKALEALVRYLLQKGVSGFYLTGSTGEGMQMDFAERNAVVECVCSLAACRVPVVAHTGALSTHQAIRLSQAAQAAGAAGISSVPPFYYAFSEREIIGYYTDLAASTDLPLFIYNIPATTGVDISLAAFSKLFASPSISGLKFTSTDMYKMERIAALPSRPIV